MVPLVVVVQLGTVINRSAPDTAPLIGYPGTQGSIGIIGECGTSGCASGSIRKFYEPRISAAPAGRLEPAREAHLVGEDHNVGAGQYLADDLIIRPVKGGCAADFPH